MTHEEAISLSNLLDIKLESRVVIRHGNSLECILDC